MVKDLKRLIGVPAVLEIGDKTYRGQIMSEPRLRTSGKDGGVTTQYFFGTVEGTYIRVTRGGSHDRVRRRPNKDKLLQFYIDPRTASFGTDQPKDRPAPSDYTPSTRPEKEFYLGC